MATQIPVDTPESKQELAQNLNVDVAMNANGQGSQTDSPVIDRPSVPSSTESTQAAAADSQDRPRLKRTQSDDSLQNVNSGYPHNLEDLYAVKRIKTGTPPLPSTPRKARSSSSKSKSKSRSVSPPSPQHEQSRASPPPPSPPSRVTPPPPPAAATAPSTPAASSVLGGFSAFAGPSTTMRGFKSASAKSGSTWMTELQQDNGRDSPNNQLGGPLDDPFAAPLSLALEPQVDENHANEYNLAQSMCPTGEEEEDVEAEIKRLKVFIKRGEDGFSGGIVGNIKLLLHPESGARRLLFRRDTLLNVAMNVRLNPFVRCMFDAEEGALRVLVTEPAKPSDAHSEANGVSSEKGIVTIYALRPSKTLPAATFRDFADKVVHASAAASTKVDANGDCHSPKPPKAGVDSIASKV
ncbi:hypothetical protein FISHEDRAFT_70372 [Fistulina hepatica ATCC 64428]|uniref:RanBD1 domain-containing protein n=1 Tax=Fistulina hepatica ATCC 64428 TaxID=1128425 RepID=A0A0D7AJD7_9AGAR|nr:hypothetical protein FISHEDRAFT_70372 [Fistulina hepatica ATCC 64428]